jgi:glycosyltransferase involved in cell wall biosynthesis
MRLLIATPLYPPDLGGPATYAKLLEEDFPFPVSVVKFSEVRSYPKLVRHLSYFWLVYRAAKDADVVLALDPVSVGLPALWAARLRRKTFVVKVVGDYAWEQGVQRFGITDTLDAFVRRGRVPFVVSLFQNVQTHVAKGAKRVIVPSNYLKGIVSAWGIPPEYIEVVYNAIELEGEGVVPEAVSALPRPLIVTASRLVPWKRVGGIIDAVAALPMDTEASLLVIGDGPNRQMLEAQAERLLHNRSLFAGALTHADTLASIKAADIFVLNSTYEGLSHVLIEALMLGKPVIATNVGGNGELITNEENGLLIPSNDTKALTEAIERLMRDAQLRERIAQSALSARERFSSTTMRMKTAAYLETL